MRIYNNYDGYMYTIKELQIGNVKYKDVQYNLDDPIESQRLLNLLVEEGALSDFISNRKTNQEVYYKFNSTLLSKEMIDEKLNQFLLQRKPILLNLRSILRDNS
jgi:hypothetical protein